MKSSVVLILLTVSVSMVASPAFASIKGSQQKRVKRRKNKATKKKNPPPQSHQVEKKKDNGPKEKEEITSAPVIKNSQVAKELVQLEDKLTENTGVLAFGTKFDSRVALNNMVPRGAAVITSSGSLAKRGINHIIHAASGAMGGVAGLEELTNPSLEGVILSVRNSILLASNHGYQKVAVPFIGGAIFAQMIGVEKNVIAHAILASAIETIKMHGGGMEVVFTIFGKPDLDLFTKELSTFKISEGISIVEGDITQFNTHGCSVIVNAANMEVSFGGGLSGVIARASEQADEINAEAAKTVSEFNQSMMDFGRNQISNQNKK